MAEEMDFASVAVDPGVDAELGALFERAVHAHNIVLAARHGFDPAYGRRLARDLEDAELLGVGCEGRTAIWHGGQAGGRVWKLTLAQLREPMIESGVVTAADVDGAISLCDDPSLSFMSQIVVAAWGHASSRSLEGPRFAAVTENARTLSRQLENHNRSYDRLETRDLADRLLAGDGAYWRFYPA